VETALKSSVAKRSVIIGGHKTSVSLEDPFWKDLKEIAYLQRATLSQVVEEIDRARRHDNLSSAIRLFVLDQVRMHGDPWRYSRLRRPAKPCVACSLEVKRTSISKPNPKMVFGRHQRRSVVFSTDKGNRRGISVRRCQLVLADV
jgi:predicted DNA-binding ribbon-helix-helix protein